MILTHEGGRRDFLWRWRRVRGPGLEEGHVGWEEQLTAAVLTEENRQEDASGAALIKGRSHPLEHGIHLCGEDKPVAKVHTDLKLARTNVKTSSTSLVTDTNSSTTDNQKVPQQHTQQKDLQIYMQQFKEA